MIDVLIIDDDALYGELTKERLDEAGFTSEFFEGPFGSMNQIRAMAPRVVVLDVNMPGLNGTNICELLRKSRGLSETKVLLHSSLEQRELDTLCETWRADAALHKSATGAEFLTVVRRLVRAQGGTPSRAPARAPRSE